VVPGIQEALFEVETRPERRYFQQILDALIRSGIGADPLDAELVISRVCGTVWAGQEGVRDGATEEAFGLGLVEQARYHPAPPTLAVLRTLAVVAPIREVREAAARVAEEMSGSGIPEPRWIVPVGSVTAGRCWAYEDIYGDQTTVICEFGYGAGSTAALGRSGDRGTGESTERHSIIVQVDHAQRGVATSAVLSYDVATIVRDLRNEAKAYAPMFTLRQVEPGWARALLSRAFARTDLVSRTDLLKEITSSPGLAELRALVLARLNVLPYAAGSLAVEPAPAVPEYCAAVVAEFLGSPEAQALADQEYASAVATLVVEYSSEYDPGQLTRVSPIKWDIFLFDWPSARSIAIPSTGSAGSDTFRAVVQAWSTWGARRSRLPDRARDELAKALDEALDELFAPRPATAFGR
jgi:hypothetical protein